MIISFCTVYAFLFDTLVSLIHCHNIVFKPLFIYTMSIDMTSVELSSMDTLGTKNTCPD